MKLNRIIFLFSTYNYFIVNRIKICEKRLFRLKVLMKFKFSVYYSIPTILYQEKVQVMSFLLFRILFMTQNQYCLSWSIIVPITSEQSVHT